MEIHVADKAYRKRAVWVLAAMLVLCGALLWQLQVWLNHVTYELGSSNPQTVRTWLRWLLAGLGLALATPAVGLGLTLRQMASASRVEGRFPPARWRTLRDVRILRDADALHWARRVEIASTAMLVLAGLLIGWALWAWWHYQG
ncbi:hypothetical protein [Lysobacter terrae]